MVNEAMTVSEFNSILNQTLSFAYPEVVIEGEVASYKVNQGKWVFFDLKDENNIIGCFMTIYQLKTELEDGMLIRVKACPQLTKWGKFSLTVKEIELAGEGSVKKAFDLLRAKFEKEGLFLNDRKRKLNEFPQNIALVTSKEAAAFNDFVTIIDDRWAGINIDHIQVQVQGLNAPEQIVGAIIDVNSSSKKYDALVIIRGGGSAEDLQAFNNEDVVRAIYASQTPTLVAIGHEDDITLSELVADVRGATPTDAARRLVADKSELLNKISLQKNSIISSVDKIVSKGRSVMEGFFHTLEMRISNMRYETAEIQSGLSTLINGIFQEYTQALNIQKKLLGSLDPSAILARGYSIVRADGRILKKANDYKSGQNIMIQLHQGQLFINERKPKDNDKEKQTELRF